MRVCAFVPAFLLDSCMLYVRMFYGPSWSDLNKYTQIHYTSLQGNSGNSSGVLGGAYAGIRRIPTSWVF